LRRADRLFALIQALRGGRSQTARDLAATLEVSERTIYRDIMDLQGNGVPIDGERGVGYLLRDDYFLPPLKLTHLEKQALTWGVAFVAAHGDKALSNAARELQIKINAKDAKSIEQIAGPLVFGTTTNMSTNNKLARLREAVLRRQKVEIHYSAENKSITLRTIWPLGLEHWGLVWTVTAWCEKRDDFRTFRIDRIKGLNVLVSMFPAVSGKTMVDFINILESRGTLMTTGHESERLKHE
jgi:predicted DNA-binding transcriptional regulator YafY